MHNGPRQSRFRAILVFRGVVVGVAKANDHKTWAESVITHGGLWAKSPFAAGYQRGLRANQRGLRADVRGLRVARVSAF